MTTCITRLRIHTLTLFKYACMCGNDVISHILKHANSWRRVVSFTPPYFTSRVPGIQDAGLAPKISCPYQEPYYDGPAVGYLIYQQSSSFTFVYGLPKFTMLDKHKWTSREGYSLYRKQLYRCKRKDSLIVGYSLLVGYSSKGSGMCGAFGNHSGVLRVIK